MPRCCEGGVVGGAARLRPRRAAPAAARRAGPAPGAASPSRVELGHGVRRADHVEVDVRADPPPLVAASASARSGASRAAPSSSAAPERRAARAPPGGFGPMRLGQLDERRHAAAVVVDARPARHRVEVAAGHHDLSPAPPGVSAITLCVSRALARRRPRPRARSAPSPTARSDTSTTGIRMSGRRERGARHSAAGRRVVEHHERARAGRLGVEGLGAEEALAAAHERHVARRRARRTPRRAAAPGCRRRRPAARPAAGVARAPGSRARGASCAAVDAEPRRSAAAKYGKRTGWSCTRQPRLAEPLRHVVGRGVVAGRARRAVAAVLGRRSPEARSGAAPAPRA